MNKDQVNGRAETAKGNVKEAAGKLVGNERLTAEVREVIGDDHVTVPADRPQPSRGEASVQPGHRLTAELKPNRFIIAMTGGSFLKDACTVGCCCRQPLRAAAITPVPRRG